MFERFNNLPQEWKYLILFILGSCIGAWINWFVDTFCWRPKYRSPWRLLPEEYRSQLSKRCWDYCPILGWFFLSRFAKDLFSSKAEGRSKRRKKFPPAIMKEGEKTGDLPGCESRWFWIRPLLIECACGFFPIFLYHWEVVSGSMKLNVLHFSLIQQTVLFPDLPVGSLTLLFVIHLFFFFLMLAASLIDFDDYIIPDALTLPGTVIGLISAAVCPFMIPIPFCGFYRTGPEMPLVKTGSFSEYWNSLGLGIPLFLLLLMIAIWSFWCFAILDRRWYGRFGQKKAFFLFLRTICRSRLSRIISVLYPIGVFLIVLLYQYDPHWLLDGSGFGTAGSESPFYPISCRDGLFNALIGMAVGMILIWTVRIVGRWSLGREAMGFGDVMLMGMLGIYIGWQGTIIVFFLAPFAGVLFGILRIFAGMEKEIPYGPFLCLAAGIWMIGRNAIWQYLEPALGDPMVAAIMFVICAVLLAVMLFIWRMIKNVFIG
ncbi:MAG: A24 family peptidase [Planctomycetia bacterium]|nr:A24 family peptidase [Planctomycetia bacterium]